MIKKYLKPLLNNRIIYQVYQFTKKVRIFFRKGITASKALTFYVNWSIKEKKKLYDHLSADYGMKNIRCWNPLRWKDGTIYLKAENTESPMFIKMCGSVNTTKREITAISAAQERSTYLGSHTPILLKSNPNDTKLLIEKEIKGLPLSNVLTWSNEKKDEVIKQLFEIYKELKKANIKHLDIRPANFLVSTIDDKPNVILIDFGFALVDSDDIYEYLEKNKTINTVLKTLGSDYSYRDGTWDDAYSFYLTIKYLDQSLMKDYPEIWNSLNSDIGLNVVSRSA